MLSAIKKLINEKMAFQEAADIIMEDTDLDDSIILDDSDDGKPEDKKEGENDVPDPETELDPEGGTDTAGGQSDVPETPTDVPAEPEDDLLDAPVEGDAEGEDIKSPMEEEIPKEEDGPTTGLDDLPEPVGKQTGDPIDDRNNILSMEIDLQSNTVRDTLPYPPANAADAVNSDDIMSQRIDTGFEKDDKEEPEAKVDDDDIMDAPVDSEDDSPVDDDGTIQESADFNLLSEAITVDDGSAPPADAPDPNAGGDEPAPDAGNAEENSVTQAVKDKVAEADAATTDVPDDGGADLFDGSDSDASSIAPAGQNVDKQTLYKKLQSLTNGIEDAKKELVSSMS